MLIYSIGIFFVESFWGLALYALFLACYIMRQSAWHPVSSVRQGARHFVSWAPLIATLKIATPLYIICVISFLCNALTWTGSGLVFYAEGITRGTFYVARILLLGWMSLYIANSISLLKFSAVFKWFLWPLRHLKVPVESISMACAIALRFIPEIYIEFQTVREAQWSRGAKLDQGGVIARTQAYCGCFVPLLVKMLIASDDLANALESRCWGYRQVAPSEDLTKLSSAQVGLTISACALLILIAIIF